jgi:hypothetical protein
VIQLKDLGTGVREYGSQPWNIVRLAFANPETTEKLVGQKAPWSSKRPVRSGAAWNSLGVTVIGAVQPGCA